MILTNCAVCAAPLAHDAPRCARESGVVPRVSHALDAGTGSRGASAARPAARRPSAAKAPAPKPAPAPRASSFDAGDAWDANDDLDDILGDGWDDDSPTGKTSVSPPPRSLSSLSGAVSPGEDSDDDFFASLGMESKPKFRK